MLVRGVADDGAVVTVALPADDPTALPALHAELVRRWPPQGLRREDPPEATAEGAADDASAAADTPLLRLRLDATTTAGWDRVESDLGLFAAERVSDRVAVHAALALVDGRAVVLPGRSFAGKTTLGLALAAEGAVLASDEYALVDPATGLVTGWPRPARVRMSGGDSRREPVAAAIPPTPVALVALLRFDAALVDAERAVEVAPLTRADAVVRVLDETVCARSRPDPSFDAALHLSAADVVAGRRGAADLAARWIVARVRGEDLPTGPATGTASP